MNTNLPKLTIPVAVPSNIPRKRGRQATNAFNSTLHVRFNKLDQSLISRAGALYGVRKATFVRWAAVQMAASLIEAHDGERPPVIDP